MSKYRSRASRLRSRSRRQQWLRWRSQQHALVPEDRLWLMYQLAVRFWGLAKPSTVNDSGMSNVPKQSRQRDIFPLAPLGISEHRLPEWDSQRWGVLRCFANAVIGALNWCYGCKLVPDRRRHRTAAQSDVVHRVVARSVEFYLRLQKSQPGSWESFTPDWVPLTDRPSGPKYGDLRAEAVDVLPQAGVCDPTPCLPEHVQQIVNDEVAMFSVAPGGQGGVRQAGREAVTGQAAGANRAGEGWWRCHCCGKAGWSTPTGSVARTSCLCSCHPTTEATASGLTNCFDFSGVWPWEETTM